MFTENEIAAMVEIPAVKDEIINARKDFIAKEARYLEISEHDFLSLVMMTPTLGIALANGSIGFMEEISLNKKARRMSKGGFVLMKDPVSDAMKYLIKNFAHWEQPFYDIIKQCMQASFDISELRTKMPALTDTSLQRFTMESMKMPYIAVRFLAAIFIKGESDIIQEKKVSQIEFEKIQDIATKLGLSDIPFVQLFLKTFSIRSK